MARALCPALVAALLSWPGPADGEDAGPTDAGVTSDAQQVRVVRVRDLLARAVSHYQRSEFEEARRQLQEILGYLGDERSRIAEETHKYLAFVHVAYGETDAAVEAFEKALAIDPELRLSSPAPRIAAAFEQARRRFRAAVRALDHDPPRLKHEPPRTVRYGDPVTIKVEASDPSDVKRVVLSYRTAGNRGYSSVTLEHDGHGRYVATIPTIAVRRPGVEYYIEAWDELGNGPGLKGSAAAPIKIEVKGGPKAPRAAAEPPPWYKRWWVWAIASGVVVAAGGIGVAAYLTRDETARISGTFPAGLDPPGGK